VSLAERGGEKYNKGGKVTERSLKSTNFGVPSGAINHSSPSSVLRICVTKKTAKVTLLPGDFTLQEFFLFGLFGFRNRFRPVLNSRISGRSCVDISLRQFSTLEKSTCNGLKVDQVIKIVLSLTFWRLKYPLVTAIKNLSGY
jgi:hypothetical protein